MFSTKHYNLFPGCKIKQLWLHRYGCESIDQVWIEHNDFLVDAQSSSMIRNAMINYLVGNNLEWHEIFVGLSKVPILSAFHEQLASSRTEIESPSFTVNLTGKYSVDSYLADLSKNSRSQILRSKRLLENQGQLELKQANDIKEKQHFLSEIAEIHIDKWSNTRFGSGFNNPVFNKFHRKIILEDESQKYSKLYGLFLNNEALGYIYILAEETSWNFYLSAIKPHSDNRIKVGLVIHTLVIEEAIASGALQYRFLAGDARYKKSLSNTEEYLQKLVCFYKPTLSLKLREGLRYIKNYLNINTEKKIE
ncbi:GNAT family N-acetyltransferase [Paraglaciecola sp. 25GB23A]|uniref:GNAT family N-acetyltransferase n=1 Tax=Paraglaciecola sp. 25GB23A TaxID=3156068 RepID=UPI0032AEF85B